MRVGVLGCGNVGAALVELLTRDADVIASRTGVRLEVGRVAVRNLAKERAVQLPEGTLTHDAEDGTGTPMLMARSGHTSARSLAPPLSALRLSKTGFANCG